MRATVYIDVLTAAARDLASEHGENPEYDRALVELVMRVTGASEDDRAEVEASVLHYTCPECGQGFTDECECGYNPRHYAPYTDLPYEKQSK